MAWGAVFPGQGSQQPMMGHYLYENFKMARELFEEASDAIHVNFKELCFSGDETELQLTQNTQPALLLISTVAYQVFQSITAFTPLAAAGHSVGEYAALVNSGVLKFSDAIKAVRIRGEAMQAAVPVGEGAMCAVLGLTDEQTRDVCTWVQTESQLGPIEPANFNSPGQVVVSGQSAAIQWLISNFKKEVLADAPARAKFIPLKVSAPFHCSLMKPAEEKMRTHLECLSFNNSNYGIVQNFTGKSTTLAATLRENIIRQVTAPVLWTQCVEESRNLGVQQFIEFGPGKVLAGLIKKIDSEKLQTFNLNSLEELREIEKLYASKK